MLGIRSTFSSLKKPSKLTDCVDVSDLATLLGKSYHSLIHFLYNGKRKYKVIALPKKTGGTRLIYSPNKKLKEIQHDLKLHLDSFYTPRKSAHGFIEKRSIVTNAEIHVNKRFILNIDLEDFFGSIHFGRVRQLLMSQPIKLPFSVATVIAHICCHNGKLPPGAPTSPVISNMIAFKLDGALQKLAQEFKCTYTRYADDITFSFTYARNRLPKDIVHINKIGEITLGERLINKISENGFKINEKKTRLSKNNQRQVVTGLKVNKKVNVSREYIRATSSMIHALKKFGPVKAEEEHLSYGHKLYTPARQDKKIRENPGFLYIEKLTGRLHFIKMVRGEHDVIYRRLMFQFTEAIGKPNYIYSNEWLIEQAKAVYVVTNYADEAQGTGFFLDGYGFVTNSHVIKQIDENNIIDKLTINHWDNYDSNVMMFPNLEGEDEKLDIALLTSLVPLSSIKHLKVSKTPSYNQNEIVYTIGFPHHKAGDEPKILEGVIMGKIKILGQERYKISQNIRHGNSGGPVINQFGEVIGIVTNGNKFGSPTRNDSAFVTIEDFIAYFGTK